MIEQFSIFSLLKFTVASPIAIVAIFSVYLIMVYLIVFPLIKYKKSVEKFILNYSTVGSSEDFIFDGVTKRISAIMDANIEHALKNNQLLERAKKDEDIFVLSQKVAHDIRSPISTLNLVSSRIVESNLKELALAATRQINEISNKLLAESRKKYLVDSEIASSADLSAELSDKSSTDKVESLSECIQSMLSELEKELKFKEHLIDRKLCFDLETNFTPFARHKGKFDLVTVKRCISNFVQNSIEATDRDGSITIGSYLVGGKIEISVNDTGCGIPKDILNRLLIEKISYGKSKVEESFSSGNGIALYNAKKDLEEIGIGLKIYSVQNRGTTVSILI